MHVDAKCIQQLKAIMIPLYMYIKFKKVELSYEVTWRVGMTHHKLYFLLFDHLYLITQASLSVRQIMRSQCCIHQLMKLGLNFYLFFITKTIQMKYYSDGLNDK